MEKFKFICPNCHKSSLFETDGIIIKPVHCPYCYKDIPVDQASEYIEYYEDDNFHDNDLQLKADLYDGNENYHISRKWFKSGREEDGKRGEEIAVKFIAYWISFNSFYAHNADQDKPEWLIIEEYIKDNYEELFKGIINFSKKHKNEVDDLLKIFMQSPVLKEGNRPDEKINYRKYLDFDSDEELKKNKFQILRFKALVNSKNDDCTRFVNLILTIYQIRCNLFHGSKSPDPKRDYDLINYSQEIMERVLSSIFEKKLGLK